MNETRRRHRRFARPSTAAAAVTAMVLSLLLAVGAAPVVAQEAAAAQDTLPSPVDPQNWVDQEDLTWADYTPVPNFPQGWIDGSVRGSQDDYKGAVVLVDFTDQPFLISQEPEAHPFGNPQPGWEPVAPEDVRAWMQAYLNTPNEFNGQQSINKYWMETSHGRLSVDLTAFGPYTLPGKVHEYGLAGHAPVIGPDSRCPLGDVCNKQLRSDAAALWQGAEGADVANQFDFTFYVTAGHDESSTWQEFGEMMFESQDDVPAAFGPPGAEDGTVLNNAGMPMPNWSPTRYVPWTSWRAAANHWPNASGGTSTQAESSGQSVYAHEFSHIRGLPDNYNNPFADNIRNYTGYWEMMSRGTFNGPGGTHSRWQVPNAGGSGLGPHHTLHFKRQLGVLDEDDQVLLERNALQEQGVAVATLQARSSTPDGTQVGLMVGLGSEGYTAGNCESQTQDPSFWCPPGTSWQNFSMEVVDRVGNDSFTPGHGVLLAQNRSSGTPRVWLVDPNPQDIGMVDFYRPDGTPVPVVRGDPRQLNDATWHAGTDSGSEFEYVEEYNRLHFYILDTYRDGDGVLYYDVAVRHLDGAGGHQRDLELGQPTVAQTSSSTARVDVPLANTGAGGSGLYDSDIYRLSATVDGEGWEAWLPHEVRAVAAGGLGTAQVFATAAEGAAESATLTITATSETDPTATRSITVPLATGGGGGGGDDPAETALTLAVEGKGSKRSLVAQLTAAADRTPVAGEVIRFTADDGVVLGDVLTDQNGRATLSSLPPGYRGGNRQFTATFAGSEAWQSASASTAS